ncbi:MAG: EamA family transporter [Verrucomicrobiota bacterium]
MLYLAAVSLIWAFSFGLTGRYLSGIDSFVLSTIRLGIAFAIFLPFLKWKKIERIDQARLFLCGAIQFGLMYISYIKAYQYIPSHLVALFSVLTPIYVVLLGDLKRKKFRPIYLLAGILSVLGAAVIRAKEGASAGNIWMGFCLMQVAGFAFAFGQVYYRHWKKAHPKIMDHSAFGLLYFGGLVFALISSLVLSDWSTVSIDFDQWKVLLYLGAIASGVGFFLWNKGATVTTVGTLGAFNNVVIPLAIFVSLFVFDEVAGISTEDTIRLLIGSTLIGSAVWIGRRKIA